MMFSSFNRLARIPRLQTSLVTVVIAALSPVFALVIHISIQSQDASLLHAKNDLLAATRLAALGADRSVEAARLLLSAITSAPSVKSGDLERCAEYFANLDGKLTSYVNAGIIDLDGKVSCQLAKGARPSNLTDRDYFQQVLATGKFAIGGYTVGRLTGMPGVPFAGPVHDASGKLSGVAFAFMDLQTLAINIPIDVTTGVELVITDRNNVIVGGDKSITRLLGTRFTKFADPSETPAFKSPVFEKAGRDGHPRFYATAPVGEAIASGLLVTASIRKDDVLSAAKDRLALSLALLTLLAGMGIAGARWVGSRTIVVPMRRLLSQVNELGGSDMPSGNSISLPETSNELIELSDAFHRLTQALLVRKQERDQTADLLKLQIQQQLVTQEELSTIVHKLTEAQRLAHLGSWNLSLKDGSATWSEEFYRIFGIQAGDVTPAYEAFLQMVHPEDRADMDAAHKSAIRNRLPVDHEHRIVGPDGAIRYVRERGELVLDGEGSPVAMTGTVLDITDLRGAQHQAETASELLTVAHRVADMGSWDMDIVNHRLTFSPEACQLFGMAPEAFDGRYETYLAAILPEDRPGILRSRRLGATEKKMRDVEYRVRRPDGEIRWMFERGNLSFDSSGNETRRTGMVMDITERKKSEAQLHLLDVAVSRLNDIVLITEGEPADASGRRIVFVNDAFVRRMGYGRDEVLGQSTRILHGPETDRAELDCIGEAMQAKRPMRTELINYSKSGERIWVELDIVPIVDGDGHCTHWVSVERDITERKLIQAAMDQLNAELEDRVKRRTAELQAMNAELEAFSYSVSHDLRSPLNTIDGFSHLLAQLDSDRLSEKGKHYVSRIRAGTKQMGELIDGLLSLAKSARDPLHCQDVDLAIIARRVEQECREREPAREVEVLIPLSLMIRGDLLLLSLVIQNLLTNAWKFTAKQSGGRIEVGSEQDSEGNVFYFVRDNGAGFNMAYAEKLFGTFERLHSPTEFTGTGVGLAIVKRVIDRHAGRVWAESEEGKGAAFFFVVPADNNEDCG
ncbi:MAG: PAS domain-containing protein [Polaromonas sp.]|uniref:PAS domain-containing protein n=1 Tax=Polaromonas sp. TaxID=1869339 RepID=UPI002486EBB1|nr:PAS domain-containing protein [Polaromonas sp.]MDI1270147.1 PAS domain-containing protein [Polaromonas sp.]